MTLGQTMDPLISLQHDLLCKALSPWPLWWIISSILKKLMCTEGLCYRAYVWTTLQVLAKAENPLLLAWSYSEGNSPFILHRHVYSDISSLHAHYLIEEAKLWEESMTTAVVTLCSQKRRKHRQPAPGDDKIFLHRNAGKMTMTESKPGHFNEEPAKHHARPRV